MSSEVDRKQNISKFRKALEFLKKRYNLESDVDLLLIILLFSVTGSNAVKLGYYFLDTIGVNETMSPFIFWPIRVLVVFMVYQLLFILFGYIIGLFRKSVWGFTKMFSDKMLSRFGIKIMGNDSPVDNK